MGGARHEATYTSGAWPSFLQPGVSDWISQFENLVMPGGQIAQYPGALNQQVAPFNPVEQSAMQGTLTAAGGMGPLTGASEANLTDTLSGKFLDPSTNPYLKSTYDQAARAMTDQYSMGTAPAMAAAAERGGGLGGSGYQDQSALSRFGLGQNLAGLATDIYGGNYQAERARQMQAQGLVPTVEQGILAPSQAQMGVGATQQQQSQQVLDTAWQNAMRQQQFPFTIMDQLGAALSTALGPAGQSMTTAPVRAGWLK